MNNYDIIKKISKNVYGGKYGIFEKFRVTEYVYS